MSEYHVISLALDNPSAIIKALEELGYKPQVFDVAKSLHGYRGDSRVQKANIIIPRSQVGHASNDIGFEKVGDNYILHISEYDLAANKFDQTKFKHLYNKHKIEIVLAKNNKYRKIKTTIDEKGNIKIRLGRR